MTAIVATVATPSLANDVFGGQSQKQCMIFLPPSYAESDRRYPTIYFLAGGGSFASNYFHLFTLETIVKGVIIVVADGQHSVIGSSHYANSPVTGNWEDFIAYDVVNYVDANFRTINSSDFRGIAGFSMGGWGALTIAMKHPEVFGAIYAIAPPMFDENGLWDTIYCSATIKTRVLDLLDSLSGLNASEAHNQYVSMLNGLYPYDDLRATIAYGSAYAPDLTIGAPYFRYMYYRNASGHAELNQTTVEAWENGRGNLEEKIPFFRQNLLYLDAIVIEYGLADSPSLQRGCEYFSQIATAQGINHIVIRTNYAHTQDIARFRDYMMPFFWEIFAVDTTKPDITNVVQDPLTDILPDTVVKINASVTDATSEIKQVTLNYTTGDGTWITVAMTNLEEGIWNATIPALPYGTNVTYMIIAEDTAGNTITTEQVYGYKYEYPVVSEFPSLAILLAFKMTTLLSAIVLRKKRTIAT